MMRGRVLTLGAVVSLVAAPLGCKQQVGSAVKDDAAQTSSSNGAGMPGDMSAAMTSFIDTFVAMKTADDVQRALMGSTANPQDKGGGSPNTADATAAGTQATDPAAQGAAPSTTDGSTGASGASLTDSTPAATAGAGAGAGVVNLLSAKAFDAPDAKNKSQNDIKLVSAQLMALPALRGIIYRMTKIVEENGGKAFHSAVLTSLMQVATASRIYQPTQNSQGTMAWSAINDYFAYPYKGMGMAKPGGTSEKFATIQEFQDYLMAYVLPKVSESINAVNAMTLATPVVWDNKLIFGQGSFSSGQGWEAEALDRYVTLGEPERKAILAGLHIVRHNLYFFSSYNYEQFPAMVQQMGQLVGIDGFVHDVRGMSASDRAGVLRPLTSLFTKLPAADQNMPLALKDLQEAVRLANEAYPMINNRSDGVKGFQLFDPAKVMGWDRMTTKALKDLSNMVTGPCGISNVVTNAVVQVNLPLFYTQPLADLKAFMPTVNGFDTKPDTQTVEGFTGVRNYRYGMSTAWNPAAYSGIFPDVRNGDEVPAVMRDLSQSWGGWLANTPLATVSMVF